jgi:hypothetical protein
MSSMKRVASDKAPTATARRSEFARDQPRRLIASKLAPTARPPFLAPNLVESTHRTEITILCAGVTRARLASRIHFVPR